MTRVKYETDKTMTLVGGLNEQVEVTGNLSNSSTYYWKTDTTVASTDHQIWMRTPTGMDFLTKEGWTITRAKMYACTVMDRILRLPLVKLPYSRGFGGPLTVLTGCELTKFGKICELSTGSGVGVLGRGGKRRRTYHPLNVLLPVTETAASLLTRYRDQ